MNNIYKVIWSKAKNCYVVASEIARSHTKSATGSEKIGGVTRRSLLASLMALSLLCGGWGIASASLEVLDQSGTAGTVTIYTKDEVDNALTAKGTAADVASNKEAITNLKNAVGDAGSGLTKEVADQKAAIAANTASITTNKDNITQLDTKKLDKDLANSTFATKDALNGLAATVNNKVDESVVETALDGKADKADTLAGYGIKDAYTKGDVDNKLNEKADAANVNTALAGKANVGDSYTKAEADGKFATSEALNTAKTDLEGKITSAKNELDGKITANTQKIGANETAITDLKDADVRLEGKINQNTNDITGLKDKDVELSGKIDNNKNLIDQNAANITQNKNDIAAIGGRLTTAEGNIQTNADAINALDTKVGTINNGNYLDGTKSVGENLNALDAQTKTNTDEIARVNQELVNTNNHFNTELGKTNTALNKEVQERVDADTKLTGRIDATDKRTAGIKRTDTGVEEDNQTVIEGKVHFDQNGNVSDVKDLSAETITTTGDAAIGGALGVTGATTLDGALMANGEATFKDKVTVQKDLTVDGKLNVDKISMKNDELKNGKKHDSATTITADEISNLAKVTEQGNTTESQFTHNEKGTFNYAKDEKSTGKWKSATSNVTADGVSNKMTDSDENTHTYYQTATESKEQLVNGDKSKSNFEKKTAEGNTISITEKDADGNLKSSLTNTQTVNGEKTSVTNEDSSSTINQGADQIRYNVTSKDENKTSSSIEVKADGITNTSKDGTITNTAKNVTNEGTESVTNKVGNNEVKVSQNGVDIKAEDGKKIKESVGTASRVVENDKIQDTAGDSTVTTENGKGTTFGKEGSTDTTNIYGDSIKTGKIKAKDTTTDTLTAGAAAGEEGGRLTVDAKDGVKGSYKFGEYTSRSYILPNTLKSGVDNGKEPTDAGFVGSRTDHYMDENKAKLDETVKDADGSSNVTNKTSTSTVTTITDGNTTTKTEQGVKDITNTAKDGTIKNDAKDIVNDAQDTITNTAGTSITNQVNDSKVTTDVGGTTFENKTAAVSDGGTTTTQINGNCITTGRVDANELGVSDKDGDNTANLTVKAGEDGGVKASAGNGTTTGSLDVTADEVKTEVKDDSTGNSTNTSQTADGIKGYATDKDGNKTYTKVTATENSFQIQDKDGEIKNHQVNTKDKSENTIKNGTKANTVTATADGTSFTNSKANTAFEGGTYTDTTIKGNTITTGKVTMDYADVMKDLAVGGNATITGDVTAKSYKVGDKTYISADGINANDQKITNVADGSISEGSKDAVNGGQLYGMKTDLEHKVDKVGANAAAMANLHPMEFDPDSKWNIAAAMGNYGSETATAIGAFYRPNEDVMVNFSTAFGTGENMVGGGVSVRLGKGSNKLSREESNALKAQVNDLTARMDALLSVLNPNMSKDFPDVPENHWAYEAVSRLAGNDIVQGYPDGEFHGDRTMTRYEMAEIIYNALSRGAEAERELVEEFKPELQAMAASEKATAEKAEG